MLRPGPGTPREDVVRNQRERLFAAMVATVAEKGYEATRVEDLEALSGVSRKAFYRLFADKQACFLAAVEALVEPTIATIAETDGKASSEGRARKVFDSFIGLVVDQAPAARMCFVDIYAAGQEAVEVNERAFDAFEDFMTKTMAEMPGREGMPSAVVRGLIGGLHKVIHTRLYRGEASSLTELTPQLWQWGLSYEPPGEPLRSRRPRVPARETEALDQVDRLLRALARVAAEKGYPEMTVADIVARASTSQRTFYEHFANKEEAMLAAVDRGSAQMLAATLPAFRRATDWPGAVRGAFEAMFAFAAAEPDFTRLGAVEVYAAGKRALEQRDSVMEGMEALLAPGYELAPDTPAVAAEAIGGAVYGLIYDEVKRRGPESLPEMTPLATYIALAPFLGAVKACEVANHEGRR